MKMLSAVLVSAILLFAPSYSQTTPNPECAIVVPANALTAQGLATPYQLKAFNAANGPCNMNNPNQQTFVNGVILDLDTGNLFVYNPLVIDAGTKPAIAPTVPTLPANNLVALWFGTNAAILHLLPAPNGATPDSIQQANCVFGVLYGNQTDIFSQFSYCNAPSFFETVKQFVANGMIQVPPLGTALDGKPCPTVRDFFLVDQDQSDNVPTSYLVVTKTVKINGVTYNAGTTAQNTAANQATLGNNAMVVVNPSDERLLSIAVNSAIGCTPWQVPDLADPGSLVPALGLNELHAFYTQAEPIATIPALDPFVTSNGVPNLVKLNAYRVGVAQPPVQQLNDAPTNTYCQALATIAPPRYNSLKQFLVKGASPVPAQATNLYSFLVQRFAVTWSSNGGLGCATMLGIPSPITPIVNNAGVCTDGTVTVLGNLIPANAFNAGGVYSAQLAGGSPMVPYDTTCDTISPLAIGLAAGLGFLVLVDVVIIVWYFCSGRFRASPRNYPKYSEKDTYVNASTEQTNYPLTPVNPKERQSVFARMRQWV